MIRPVALWSAIILCSGTQPVTALCPSLNMSKGFDQVAKSVLTESQFVFLGTIKKESFIGDSRHAEDDPNASADITYKVDKVFKGKNITSLYTVRTPFYCEDCAISNPKALKELLDAAVGERKIVYAFEKTDENGRKHLYVSGGCPASIDAGPYGYGSQFIEAFTRASNKSDLRASPPSSAPR